MYSGSKFLILISVFGIVFSLAKAQVEIENLKPLLSTSDQKTLKKADENLNNAYMLEDEAEKIKSPGSSDKEKAKFEKKYVLKRLEAAEYYKKSNNLYINLLKDNISEFWKKKKNEPNLAEVKIKEDKAQELVRKARASRGVSEDLIYPEEKLEKIMEAEKAENEAIQIFVKVLYAYLNYPINYDLVNSVDLKPSEVNSKDSSTSKSASTQSKLDTVLSVTILVKKDSTRADSIIKPTVVVHSSAPNKTEEDKKESTLREPEKSNVSSLKDTSSLYEIANIKEDEVDRFNKFLETSYPDKYENYIINFRELDYSDINSLREAWYSYLYSNNESTVKNNTIHLQDTSEIASNINKLKLNTNKEVTQQTLSGKIKKSPETNTIKKDQTLSGNDNNSSQKEFRDSSTLQPSEKTLVKNEESTKLKKPHKEVSGLSSVTPAKDSSEIIASKNEPAFELAKGFLYRVQISACRIAVDEKNQRNIYNGNLQILELQEENWFKYAIGEFNNYTEARNLRDQQKIPGAFVIAYLNGKRIPIRNNNQEKLPAPNQHLNTITFKVQVAASKSPLEKKYLTNIYPKSERIEEMQEDGWYKYAINFGPDFISAQKFIAVENIPGAFIKSYLGDKKIDLSKAITTKKTKQL